MQRHGKLLHGGQCLFGRPASDFEERRLGRESTVIHEIKNPAFAPANDSGMRLGGRQDVTPSFWRITLTPLPQVQESGCITA
jgi:hypothetical protein